MEELLGIVLFMTGLAIGALASILFYRKKISLAEEKGRSEARLLVAEEIAKLSERLNQKEQQIIELKNLEDQRNELLQENSKLREQIESERKIANEKLALLEDAKQKLSDTFKALSSRALEENSQFFLNTAKEVLEKYHEIAKCDLESKKQAIDVLVKPIEEALKKVDEKLQQIETNRAQQYGMLNNGIQKLAEAQLRLQSETSKLVNALKIPSVRGRWGEMQLRRVVELAGMVEHCDFDEQASVVTNEDGMMRPDMVIYLPNNHIIVVDSKAPLNAYLEAIEAPDEDKRRECLEKHCKEVRSRIASLSNRAYWKQFEKSPEFVILFLPGEMFLSAALMFDPDLIEYSISQKVIIATPTILIAVLLAVAQGWQEHRMEEHAIEVGRLGKELYERIGNFVENFAEIGKGLDKMIKSYNQAVGSLESRVLVTTRRLKELEVAIQEDIVLPDRIEREVRKISFEDGEDA
ncbi:MAG: DNA recombination protein RmuC [Methanomassiliicoccales archaeon]